MTMKKYQSCIDNINCPDGCVCTNGSCQPISYSYGYNASTGHNALTGHNGIIGTWKPSGPIGSTGTWTVGNQQCEPMPWLDKDLLLNKILDGKITVEEGNKILKLFDTPDRVTKKMAIELMESY